MRQEKNYIINKQLVKSIVKIKNTNQWNKAKPVSYIEYLNQNAIVIENQSELSTCILKICKMISKFKFEKQ